MRVFRRNPPRFQAKNASPLSRRRGTVIPYRIPVSRLSFGVIWSTRPSALLRVRRLRHPKGVLTMKGCANSCVLTVTRYSMTTLSLLHALAGQPVRALRTLPVVGYGLFLDEQQANLTF